MRTGAAALIAVVVVVTLSSCDSTEPLRPELMQATAPLEQSGTVGDAVLVAPAVRVTTSTGKAVPGVDVTFALTGGGGTLTTTARSTDASGIAVADGWTLGSTPGANTLVASATGVAASVTFTVTAQHAAPARMVLLSSISGDVQSGLPLPFPATVEFRDRFDNPATTATPTVRAEIASGDGQLSGVTAVQAVGGRAVFSSLVVTGTGIVTVRFSAPGLEPVFSTPFQVVPAVECGPATVRLDLEFALGDIRRYTMADLDAPACLFYQQARNQGQQYLVLFENMPQSGGYESAVYAGTQAEAAFTLRLRTGPADAARVAAARLPPLAPPGATHAWDFGGGPIYEIEPEQPPPADAEPRLLRAGRLVELQSASAAPQVGDTLVVFLNGISRLGIPSGNQKVVVRYVSDELIITEDSRLTTTLPRQNGSFNTPLTAAQLEALAQNYAAHGRVQGDSLFQRQHNSATASANDGRVIAVHSLMNADNIWGYTYSTTNYFVWDFWVGVANGATAGSNQQPQRVADNLFMHEITHMRHAGLLEQNGLSWQNQSRGNKWVVEGFARFTERLPIAARLLGTSNPSRVDNVTLPLNPLFNGAYFRDDVPTFLNAGSSMFEGYQNASFVFDYFADQIALQGGDWRAALREFLLRAGQPQTLDPVVGRWVAATSFDELFTRARVALYTDDIGDPLPAWTQYHQFQLRASRPPGSASGSDPRNAWPRLVPGAAFDNTITVLSGGGHGYLIDGTQAGAADARIVVDAPRRANAVMSVTRIR
jgi:hypothetical protein